MIEHRAKLVIQVSRKYKMQIIHVHASTINNIDDEDDNFYKKVALMNQKDKILLQISNGRLECSLEKKEGEFNRKSWIWDANQKRKHTN